ncbi:MAG: metallophosphoesterase, partial [bacterium]|nr:metallophosphoesterase [bacterium]
MSDITHLLSQPESRTLEFKMPLATVLHLSDPQFGLHHRFGSEQSFDTLQSRLREDLGGLRDDKGLGPDLLIVTGDLAERGLKSELEEVLRFLDGLTDFLELGRDRVVVVPGNHDVNRPACEAYFKECEADEVEPAPPFWPKWKHYARFFHAFYRDCPGVDFTEDEPWSLFEIPALQVVVAGLNSTMAESHREDDHYGQVGEEQLHWFRERLEPYREKGWLRIAAVHHNVVRGDVEDDENLHDADDLKRVLGPDVNLILHGHTHDGKLYWHDPQTPILSTGSAALKPGARPGEIPNQYQVIQIWDDRFRRWTRGYAPDRNSWIGDNRASADGSCWWDEQPLRSEVSLAPRVGRKTPDRDDVRFEARDDFLSRVETVCRLREKDAEIRRLRTGSPPVEYLRVSVEEDGIVRCYPVGAIDGDVNPESFDAFLAVSHRYQRTDQGLISTLVYGGEPPAAETVRRARAERVRLRSFTEYLGLLDFRSYVDHQTRKLAAVPLYPPSLYVPQRMRFTLGQEERNTGDALATVNDWLADSYGRFVLVLGDFGTGKTFL